MSEQNQAINVKELSVYLRSAIVVRRGSGQGYKTISKALSGTKVTSTIVK